MQNRSRHIRGFTLIELSIVLVIIGLIVGGVLVGRDLIASAAVRAQITQIEKYNQAANTFRGKYNALPGDMGSVAAAQFNFPPMNEPGCGFRCGTQGRGDSNGVLDSFTTSLVTNPSSLLGGETAMFWGDLSFANLIDGSFAGDQLDASVSDTTNVATLLPPAKIGSPNYVIVYSNSGVNYFGLIAVASVAGGTYTPGTPALTVAQAYNIDRKIDDGLPTTGRVTTQYPIFNAGSAFWWSQLGSAIITTPLSASATSCFDDGGNASNPFTYSVTQNNGTGVNCALAFKFQ